MQLVQGARRPPAVDRAQPDVPRQRRRDDLVRPRGRGRPTCHAEARLTSTQHTLIAQVKAVRDHVAPSAPVVIAADQDVHRGLVELIRANPGADVVMRMGALYTLTHWTKVVAKFLEEGGFVEVLAGVDESKPLQLGF